MRGGSLLIILLLLSASAVAAEPVEFARVREILAAKCLACHGNDPQDLKGKFDLRSLEAATKGGESGEPAIVPGQPDKSPLLRAVTWEDDTLQMPPKANDRLSAGEIDILRRWIAAGAKWETEDPLHRRPHAPREDPSTSRPDRTPHHAERDAYGVTTTVATSGGLSPDWDNRPYHRADLWAYQPITRPVVGTLRVPSAAHGTRSVPTTLHPIDTFLLSRLAAAGIDSFAPPAEPRTLLRRLTFDLTGLPPTAKELEEFLSVSPSAGKDGETERQRDGGKAIKAAIARLLASPHYGERQAQHWLDVVRYADTAGFSNDFERPHAWRYRDYVVRSFNADKPFDRFVLEQLAGDELDERDPELLIAAGYLRSGPWEHTGMTVAAITRQQFLDDVTHHVGVSLLGQGLRCCACHDHKFDPLPTRDYYRMQAVFAPVQFAERPAEFLPSENIRGFEAARARVQARLDRVVAAQAALKQKNQDAIAAFLAEKGVKSLADLPAAERPKQDYLGGTFGLTKTDLSLRKIHQKSRDYLERELKRFEPFAQSVYSGPPNAYTSVKPLYAVPPSRSGDVPIVHILTGGSLASPADTVTPGVLSAMFASNDSAAPTAWNTIPGDTAGRRLALAKWIASPSNTLTARVIVNRVWQQHFGKGLVATPNNFGKMGARPTHPELLDWLATWFVEHGWSLKRLHELIVTSDAYQQGSSAEFGVRNAESGKDSPISTPHSALRTPHSSTPQSIDPSNLFLWHFPPRRLSAEEIRDAALAASGELNRELGGPGIFPEINWEVALQPRHIMGSVAPAYLPSRTPAERNRRTLYAFRIRTLADPVHEVLNRPGSETSCERRDETTVTPQAFALMNSQTSAHRALAMAARLTREHATDAERIAAAFRLVYARDAMPAESEKCLAHIARQTEHQRAHPPTPTELPKSVRRGMVEELTGEMVYWDEDLSALADYQRDLLPWQVNPEVRALADICLVLLNSNEFLYVR
ncbi:MAG: PSD1 and planctomycete cytochrome C domain-containing protein [Planctomycetaceae bacterium]|nr:PSD1 and planctomycete cytochrome C domain-containing protein [Planctomycetaceae bacterium]